MHGDSDQWWMCFNTGYKLVVKDTQAACFDHVANLSVRTKKVTILIQTDKNIYKLGDPTEYRAFIFNENLRQ